MHNKNIIRNKVARYFISNSANFFRWSEEIELVIRNIDARGIERIHRVSRTTAATSSEQRSIRASLTRRFPRFANVKTRNEQPTETRPLLFSIRALSRIKKTDSSRVIFANSSDEEYGNLGEVPRRRSDHPVYQGENSCRKRERPPPPALLN